MSNTKFTKGPWTLSSHRTIYDTNGTHICDASIGKSGVPYDQIREEEIANAKLIAAAPELLRVLFDLSENVKTLEDVRDLPIMKRILSQADEVIKKVI